MITEEASIGPAQTQLLHFQEASQVLRQQQWPVKENLDNHRGKGSFTKIFAFLTDW